MYYKYYPCLILYFICCAIAKYVHLRGYHPTCSQCFHIVLDQHAELVIHSASSLKQQSADRHVITLGHIILIPSQPIFALTP
jgi:hypothetical protein